MGLQVITPVLFTMCFFEALALECYNCSTSDPSGTCTPTANCSSNSICSSTVINVNTGAVLNNATNRFCTNSSCVDWSVNFSMGRMTTKCCSSDLCNNATDSLNGKTCPDCSNKNCSGIIHCKGDEDQCINATVELSSSGQLNPVTGCASKSFCKDPAIYELNFPVPITILNVTCSSSNTLTQGAVLLLLPLLASLLLFSI